MQSCRCRWTLEKTLDTSECDRHQPLTQRIKELEKESTQRGARMQIMRDYIVLCDQWEGDFDYLHPESKGWFDADGVPVREGE